MSANPKGHSFTRIDDFSQKCERQHAYKAILGKWVTTPAQARGTHVHDGFEEAARNTLPRNGTPALFPDDALDAVIKDPPKGPLPRKKFESYMERFRPIFLNLKPAIANAEPRVEEWFREIDGRAIRGKIDLVSDHTPLFDQYGRFLGAHIEDPCIIDYKTTSNPRSIKDECQARKSLQLQIYSLATGIPRAGFIYFMPSGEPRGAFVHFTKSELALAKRWLHDTMDVIDARWDDAAARGFRAHVDTPGPLPDDVLFREGRFYDISTFSLASVGHPLCCEKWCEFYSRCLGRKGQ